MPRDVLKQVKESSIYPDHLMGDIAKSTLLKTFVLSLVIHAVLIGLTSVRYIGQCIEYKSLQPDEIIKVEKAEEDKRKVAEARQARLDEQRAAAGAAANSVKRPTKSPPADTANGGEPVEGQPEDGDGKSPIEKTLEEVSHERPDGPSATFDNIDDL